MKFAFIFPGQGSQSVGMGREFYENSASACALLDEASDFTGIDFKNLLFEPNDKLDVSEFTQPAIALNSMMALAALQERLDQEKFNIAPQFLLGHSLGEFSALSAAGGIGPKQMLKLVNIRGRLMQNACEGKGAGMMVILALADEAVEKICADAASVGKQVWAANYNCDGQIVVAGKKDDLAALEGEFQAAVSVAGCPGYPVTLFDVVGAWLSPNKTILERDQVCPPSLSQQDVEETNQAQMTSSQNTAVVAALMETGMATRMVLTVEGTGPDQTEGLLQKGDVLTSITPAGGQATPTTTYTALRELLTTIPAGTAVELGIERDGEPMTVSLTTITPPDANSDGSPDSEGSLLGVYLSAEADSDIEATFGLSKVGGPSAGSMFALGIVDELTPGDLTGGKDIAGTGTIALDGSIGPIGGIEQKMAGAKTDGSGYFLAPASNCADVVGNVPDGLEVYAVSTLHEAVTTVEAIAAEDTSGASTCEAVLAQQ